jgi:hypothetical protein
MLGDEAPLTIETDALDCACTDTIPYFTDPKTMPIDSVKAIPRYAIFFIKINRFKYALTISTHAKTKIECSYNYYYSLIARTICCTVSLNYIP